MADEKEHQNSFCFKQFSVTDSGSAMKLGTDAVLLGAWAPVIPGCHALDIGAGSGVISLMLAQRGARSVTAIEIDSAATGTAAFNFTNSPWKDRLNLIYGDALTHEWGESTFSLIVSNPPFFSESLKSPCQARATARHEDSLPLLGLLALSSRLLDDSGSLAVIYPSARERDMENASVAARLYPETKVYVRQTERHQPKRILWLFKKHPVFCTSSILTLKDQNGSFTPDYAALTREFYLNI